MSRITAIVVAIASLIGASAEAQTATGVVLQPDEPLRWDAAGVVSWVGVNGTRLGTSWDHWYGVADVAATAGRYLTPHIKLEIDAGVSTEGHVYGQEQVVSVTNGPVPVFRYSEHYVRTSGVGAGAAYQFFDNAEFHPFVGGGVLLAREHRRSEIFQVDPRAPAITPQPQSAVTWHAQPMLTSGFKWYLSERAFFRTEARMVVSTAPIERFAWRAGFGFDF